VGCLLADIFDQIAAGSTGEQPQTTGDIFDQIALGAHNDQPLSLIEKVMGYSRSYLAGPTFNFADNIEAAVAAPFTDKTYDQELEGIRAEQNRFKDKTDYLDNAVELVSGAVLNPLGMLGGAAKTAQIATSPVVRTLAAPGVRTAIRVGTSVPFQAGLAGAGAADGKDVLENAAKSAVIGSGLSALGSVAGNVVESTARGADRMKLSAFGIGSADLARQIKKLEAAGVQAGSAADIPIVQTLHRAESQGLVKVGNDVLENAKNVGDKQRGLAHDLGILLKQADTVVKPDINFQMKNTIAYLDGISGTAREAAEDAAMKELAALTKQMGTGTLRELQDLKVGLNYKYDQNPLTDDIQKAIRSDLRQEIENRVNKAAQTGLIATASAGKVKALNSEWGELADLRDAFVRKGHRDIQGNPIEDIVAGGRTSGGVGTMNVASAASGNPIYAAIGAGIQAARGPEALSAIADVLRDPVIGKSVEKLGELLPRVVTGRNASQALLTVDETKGERSQQHIKPSSPITGSSSKSGSSVRPELSASPNSAPTQTATQGRIASLLSNVIGVPEAQASEMNFGPRNMKLSKEEAPAFMAKVSKIADDLGADPADLLAVMKFETGGMLDPTEKNKAGSGATGLIQFMPSTAKSLVGATSKEAAIQILEKMTATEQLDYVKKYLAPFKGKLNSLDDVYMAVLYPKAVGKDSEYALFEKGTKAYWQNRGLDINKDGVVTKAEATKKVSSWKT